MQVYTSIKANEFKNLYEKLQMAITALKEINIDTSKEEAEALQVKSICDSKAFMVITTAGLDELYQNGINELKAIFEKLKIHEADSLSHDLNMFDKSALQAFAGATITLLEQTSSLESQDAKGKYTVDAVYEAAYNMIKNELLASGKSRVLDWVKNNDTVSKLIASLVGKEIATISADATLALEVNEHLKGNNDANGLAYLDEKLILYLAIHDNQSLERVENALLSLLALVDASEEKVERANKEKNNASTSVESLKQKIKKNNIYKRVLATIGLVVFIIIYRRTLLEMVKGVGHIEYQTSIEYYSSLGTKTSFKLQKYMEKVDGFRKTTLVAYSPWSKVEDQSDFSRSRVEYDLTDVDLDKLEEYANLDLTNIPHKSVDTQIISGLDANAIIKETTYEITKIVQDENASVFVPNEKAQKFFNVVISVVVAFSSILGEGYLLKQIFAKVKEQIETRKVLKSELIILAQRLEEFSAISSQNEELRLRFLDYYQKFGKIIASDKLQDAYGRLRLRDSD